MIDKPLFGSENNQDGRGASETWRTGSDADSFATFSTFSMSSSIETAVFREDGGRRFQASNDDYASPADDLEFARLDRQHFGLKALYHDTNYLAPIQQALQDGRGCERKRALDIGAGTGVWAMEIAQEFPQVDWTATDLIPIQPNTAIPENLHFLQEDAGTGIGFPDDYFDLVHARALIAGMRDWPAFIQVVIRVTRPGGLVVFVEFSLPMGIYQASASETELEAPGAWTFADLMARAFTRRGFDVDAGSKTIQSVLKRNDLVRDVGQIEAPFPCSAWSDEPNWRKSGAIMQDSVVTVPDFTKLLVMDALGIREEALDQVGQEYVADIKAGKRLVYPMWHNWAWKKAL